MPRWPMPTSDLVPIGVTIFVLLALPSWVAFVYWLRKGPTEIAVAYGNPISWIRNKLFRRGYALLCVTVASAFSVVAALLVWAGLGGTFARQLLKLA